MIDREHVEKLLADVSRRREEAEALAENAAAELVRIASAVTPLSEQDPDAVRAAADTYASQLERLNLLEDFARQLRFLLL